MSTQVCADNQYLSTYGKELSDVFRMYLEDINPLIVQFEITKNEFPVEVQNEIRAMFSHLARVSTAETQAEAASNVAKIKSHAKRALLDCFKYCCVIYTDKYTDFFKQYEGVDLSYVDNGRFLPEIHAMFKKAREALLDAKAMEVANVSDEQLFHAYEDAFLEYGKLCERLDSVVEHADYLKHKATKKDLIAIVSLIVGVAGFFVGIVGML